MNLVLPVQNESILQGMLQRKLSAPVGMRHCSNLLGLWNRHVRTQKQALWD